MNSFIRLRRNGFVRPAAALGAAAAFTGAAAPAWGAPVGADAGMYFNWIWLIELAVFLAIGLGLTYWMNGNAEKSKMNRDIWIPTMLSSLLVPVGFLVFMGGPGLWLYLLGHLFPVAVFFAYARVHDKDAAVQDQLLTADKFDATLRNTLLRMGIRVKAPAEYSSSGIAIEGLALMTPDRTPIETAHRAAGLKADQLAQAQQILITFGESRVEQASIEARGDQVVISVLRHRRVSEFMKMPMEQGMPVAQYFSALMGGGQPLQKGQVGGFLIKLPDEEASLAVRGRQRENGQGKFRLDMALLHEPLPQLKIDDLDLFPTVRETLQKLMRMERGLVIVSGPANQGVTTTFYSVLGLVDALIRDMLIYETEHDQEVDHARHENVKEMDAPTLRSLLQQTAVTGCDVAGFKDVLTHPKISPREMVKMVMEQATHHITVARIEAPDTATAIAKLVDLGVDRQQLSKLLLGAVNQRLVGKLCDLCKAQVKVNPKVLQQIGLPPEAPVKFYKSVGCVNCLHSGYSGLTAVFEVMVNNRATRQAIARGAGVDELRKAAWQGGSLLFSDSTILKAASGAAAPADLSKAVAS